MILTINLIIAGCSRKRMLLISASIPLNNVSYKLGVPLNNISYK